MLQLTVTSIAPLSKVVLYDRRGVFREVPLQPTRTSVKYREQIRVSESDWFSLSTEGPPSPSLDSKFLLAGSNAVRVYVGNRKLRDRPSAEYFMRWIDVLRKETIEWPWWRSQKEKDHVLAQYEEAKRVYQRLAEEAR